MITEEVLVRYNEGRLDELYMVYTKSKNGLESETEMVKLLPLPQKEEVHAAEGEETLKYLPSPEAVLASLVPNYVTGYI